jgi:hypothetical protein
MEKFTTNHGNPGIIIDGFKFRKDKVFKNSKAWRCIDKGCNSRYKTDLEGRFEHNHSEPDERDIERQEIRQHCKRKAIEESSERPSKLIIQEIEKNNSEEMLPKDIISVRQAIYRQSRNLSYRPREERLLLL